MMNRSKRSGMILCGVLLVIFVVLKLLNLTNLSWVWVLAPLWQMQFYAAKKGE